MFRRQSPYNWHYTASGMVCHSGSVQDLHMFDNRTLESLEGVQLGQS